MSVPDTALQALQAALLGGVFAPGDRLPPERALAQRLGVGRSSLRKALDKLAREGRLTREVGRGTFVRGGAVTAVLHLDPAPGPADVMELREVIEPQIAALVALRAAPDTIAQLRALSDAAETAPDWTTWEAQDSALHTALGRASRNPLFTAVLDTLNSIRSQKAWRDLRAGTLTPARQRSFSAQHRAVIDAIAARSPQQASAAMAAHLDAVRRAMTEPPTDEAPT